MIQRLPSRRLTYIALTLTGIATLTACAGAQNTPSYVFPPQHAAAATATDWFAGEATLSEDAGESVEARFVAAEMDYWAGDVERAFDRHAALLRSAPAHPLSRFSASRLHSLHDDVVDYEQRARATLEGLTYSQVHPLTAAQLALVGQRVAWRSWRRSDSTEPFDASALGLPNRWRTSPTMSTWRLLDFDTPFAPEREARLAERYVAPTIAEDDPKNTRDTRRWATGGISLSPKLPRSGVHYLETFATVLSNEPQVFWLTGNFAAATRVFIDGEEVLVRREGDYGTSKRMRRIKLTPGTHRVLVKMAYQSGYRDWFDLSFLNAKGTPLADSRLSFNDSPPTGDVQGTVSLLSTQKKPGDLEVAVARGEQLTDASDMTLYLTALAAYDDRQSELFGPAAMALSKKAPKFAPIRALRSLQVRTLWEVPSEKRDEESLKMLREAHDLDPTSLRYTLGLGQALRQRGDAREVRALLETARDAAVEGERVRNVMPLNLWATWLQNKGWQEDAERAWARAVELAPANCGAARRLQSTYHSRSHYPAPSSYTERADLCPELEETWLAAQPDRRDERLALARRNASRYPFNASTQLALSRELRARGEHEESQRILDAALEWRPDSASIHEELADRALADRGPETALDLLSRYEAAHGPRSWSVFKAASIRGKMPLADLMQSGPEVARELARREAAGSAPSAGQGDEAFYAIDYAARRYFPDGSSVSLTHTMVRVMTKGAIDRFGEVSVPGNAHLLRARTVKADGSTASPERTAGKETLSMPSLAPGDYVELAYLQFDSTSAVSRTRRQGTKFFFKMQDISSLHSEYVVIHPDGEFIRRNDAPEAQTFTYDGDPAVRFVRRDSPRPVGEPYAVPIDERLPWVQLRAEGIDVDGFTLINRNMRETLADAAKRSPAVDAKLDEWVAAGEGAKGEDQLKKIFYAVVSDLPRASGSWSTDLAHGIATRSANPMVALLMAYRHAGIDAHVWAIKSPMADPKLDPMFESGAYSARALRVAVPGSKDGHVWLAASDQDAMFGALGDGQVGQPAVCLTCDEPERGEVPTEGVRTGAREVSITSSLDASGTLSGKLEETFTGPTAAYIRSVLRERTEETARRKFIEYRLAEYVPGANVTSFDLVELANPDAPITVSIDFSRPEWAKKSGSTLRVETPLFRAPIGSAYGALPERTSALVLTFSRASSARMIVTLPEGATPKLLSRSGSWDLNSPFGQYARTTEVTDGTLTVTDSLSHPIQRVPASEYPGFRDWTRSVEYSSLLAIELSIPE